MDKNELIWAVIRIFGIVLIVMAIMGLPSLMSTGLTSHLYSGMYESTYGDDTSEDHTNSVQTTMLWTSVVSVGCGGIRIALLAVTGIYFLRNGRLVFKLICRGETES